MDERQSGYAQGTRHRKHFAVYALAEAGSGNNALRTVIHASIADRMVHASPTRLPGDADIGYLLHMADITIGDSEGRGRGVFAARRFEAGETIEVCPVLTLSEADARVLDGTGLHDYYFGWGKDRKAAAIALGYGSLYNHSPSPNAQHQKIVSDGIMAVVAVRRIESGEEIFIRYDPGTDSEAQEMWFEVR